MTSVGPQADSPSKVRFTLTDQVYPLSQARSTAAGPHLPCSTCKITKHSTRYKCTEALRLSLLCFQCLNPTAYGGTCSCGLGASTIVITVTSSFTDEFEIGMLCLPCAWQVTRKQHGDGAPLHAWQVTFSGGVKLPANEPDLPSLLQLHVSHVHLSELHMRLVFLLCTLVRSDGQIM